ncbi:MAG: LysM peptidoglycan-binding domain-containing protein [Burkholderiaceae bacterium]
MTRSKRSVFHVRRVAGAACLSAVLGASLGLGAAQAADYPITSQQRGTAQRVAQAGVPLSELSPNAPDSYTVKPRDTLWDISKLFLKSPWRWPELWGMNLEQIRNPHLIYPGQVLVLDKSDGRARLRLATPLGTDSSGKLSPRIRSTELGNNGIPSIPFHLIEPFLNEAVIFESNELEAAPRIVATQEGRVMLSRGELAYVRGELANEREFRIFREPRPLLDPTTRELLGYEANYVGTAEYTRLGENRTNAAGKAEIVPATFTVTTIRQEAGIGDRLAVVPPRELTNYAPHAPQGPMNGQIVSLYGDALTAGQNQIVALNRGSNEGMERGHVLALWRDGVSVIDKTDASRPTIKLPDERHGVLFVFRVFKRMSYALILSVQDPVKPGDRFTQP